MSELESPTGSDGAEALLRDVARHGGRPALVRVIVALARLARRHTPQHARRCDTLLELAEAWADGRATRAQVVAAREGSAATAGAADSIASRYESVAQAAAMAATAVAEEPSLFGLSSVSCASADEVCLSAAEWALAETTALLVEALVDLGGAFVPDASATAEAQVRELVHATVAELVGRVAADDGDG